ncbi:MAG: MFS transporter [Steroidobacteraceae bacterium]
MNRTTDPYQTQLTLLLSAGFGFVFLDRNAFSYLSPLIAPDLKLDNTEVGVLSAALSLTWALSGIAIGRLADSSGHRKRILVAAFVTFSLCSAASGLAQTFLTLLGARLLMGISEGPILPISQSLLASASSPLRRGLNMGVMQNFGSQFIGNFVAPLLLVALANAYGWRAAFFIAGVPGVITAFLVARYVREPAMASAHVELRSGASTSEDGVRHSDMFRHKNMWLCILISCVMIAWMVLAWVFLPLYFVMVKKFSASAMSVLMSVLGLSAAVCSILVPWLSDRYGRKPIMVGFCLLGALTPAASLWYDGPFAVLAVLVLIGWAASGVFPLFMATVPSETLPPAVLATAVGVVMGTGELFGGVLAPSVAGWGADRYGLRAPLLAELLCTLIAGALAMFLTETAPARCRALYAPVTGATGRRLS